MTSMDWAVKCTCLVKAHDEHDCPYEVRKRGVCFGGCECCPWCTEQCAIEEPVTDVRV